MNKKILLFGVIFMLISSLHLTAQYNESDNNYKRWFIGSTLFLLGNFAPVNPPEFFQVNIGHRITEKDVITLEPKTWKYAWPNGINPFLNGNSYGSQEEQFPGYVREIGISLSYQRFLWEGLYAELNVMPTLQFFMNNDNKVLESGFQVFNTYRIGYHFKLFDDFMFIQPSVAMTHRLYHTTMPDGFKQLDDKWPKFVFPEPGLHFGFNF